MASVTFESATIPANFSDSSVEDKAAEIKTLEDESIFTSSRPKIQEHSGFHFFDKTEWNPELGDAIRCKGAFSKSRDAVGGFFSGIGSFFNNIFNGIGNFFSSFFGTNKEDADTVDDKKTVGAQKERFEGISNEIIEEWGGFADPYGDIYYDTDGELIVETRIADNDDEIKDTYELYLGEVRYDYINEDGRRILGIAVNVKNENPSEGNLKTRDGAIGDTKQGQKGDCWLLSGVNALSYTEKGRQIIEDALEYHDGYTIVHLKGAKDYEITDKEIEEARAEKYSTGDDDMLILELAIQKAFEDVNNKNLKLGSINRNGSITQKSGTIANGSHSNNLIYLIAGKESGFSSKMVVDLYGNWNDTLSNVFNDFVSNKGKDMTVVLSALDETVIQDVNGNDVKIYAPHAYALKNATNSTVTFTNPHDSSIDITVSRENAFNAFHIYQNCDLSDKNPDCEPPTFPDKVYEDGTKVYSESLEHRDHDENKATLYSKDGRIMSTFYSLGFEGSPDSINRLTAGETEKVEPPADGALSGKEVINKIVERDLINKDNLSLEEIVEYASLSESEWQEVSKDLA